MAKLFINLNELLADGKDLEGELRQDIFKLDTAEPDAPRMTGPVQYDLRVELDRGLVVVSGSLRAQFDLVCSRCLERFPWSVELEEYESEEPREGRSNLDLTEVIREDILLALPGYPHCEESSTTPPRQCPAAGKFAPSTQYEPISEEDANQDRSRDAWSALDGLIAAESAKKPAKS